MRDILPRERSARPFPSRQHRMQTGGGEATRRYSAPQSLTFPVPSEWKTPSEHRETSASFTTNWSRPVAGTDWALWKKYNPLWALRGNRNYRASDRVKRAAGGRNGAHHYSRKNGLSRYKSAPHTPIQYVRPLRQYFRVVAAVLARPRLAPVNRWKFEVGRREMPR